VIQNGDERRSILFREKPDSGIEKKRNKGKVQGKVAERP
jgi:hypothetical protein